MSFLAFIFRFLAACLLTAIIFAVLFGCQPMDPATKTQVHQIQQQAQVDSAKVQAKADVKAVEGNANPLAHPLAANTEAVKIIRTSLLGFLIASALALAAGIGLGFTPLSALSKIVVPIATGVLAVSLIGVFVLPFLHWIALGTAGLIIAFLVYEVCHAHSVAGGLRAALSLVKSGITLDAGSKSKPLLL